MLLKTSAIDFIGDIHGCYRQLINLLKELGYQKKQNRNFYYHPKGRKIFFLGDIIDRGEDIFGCYSVVREMVENSQAKVILGNHEFNYLTYFLSSVEGEFTHHRTGENLAKTYEQFSQKNCHAEFINWAYTLPILMETERWRVVHACWDKIAINELEKELLPKQLVCKEKNNYQIFINQKWLQGIYLLKKKKIQKAIKILLSAPSISYAKKKIRVKWWLNPQQKIDYKNRLFSHPDLKNQSIKIDNKMQKNILKKTCRYSLTEKLLFIGHYWFNGAVRPIQENLACLDYSAIHGGKLVAYRYDSQKERQEKIQQKNFIYV